jgi:hypothetical protein
MRVFHESEERPHGCTEAYVVKFWAMKPDGYMGQHETTYLVMNSRRSHDVVAKRWKKDYHGKNVKLISVTYQ